MHFVTLASEPSRRHLQKRTEFLLPPWRVCWHLEWPVAARTALPPSVDWSEVAGVDREDLRRIQRPRDQVLLIRLLGKRD